MPNRAAKKNQLTIKQMEAIYNMYTNINFGNAYLIYLNCVEGYPHKNDEVAILFRGMEKIRIGIETYHNQKANKLDNA